MPKRLFSRRILMALAGGMPNFPDPIAEANALAALDTQGGLAYLLLARRDRPPLSAQYCFGATVVICAQNPTTRTLTPLYEATALDLVTGATPSSVTNIYGALQGRRFRRLTRFVPISSSGLTPQQEEDLVTSSAYARWF